MPVVDLDETTVQTPTTMEAGVAGSHALSAARSIVSSGGSRADAERVVLSVLLKGKPPSSVRDKNRLSALKSQAKMIAAMAAASGSEPQQSNLGQALEENVEVSLKKKKKAAEPKKPSRPPRPVRLRIKRGNASWVARGYKAIAPRGKVYFPTLQARYQELMDVPGEVPPRVVSVCIPCFNEEADALKRTLESLQKQYLPRGIVLEIVVAMDGTAQIHPTMVDYIRTLFGISVAEPDAKKNPFVAFPQSNTVIVESTGVGVDRSNISLIIKRNNKRKVNSQRWWLFGHARDAQCEFAFATDCGIVFDPKCLLLMLERMDRQQNLSGLTGYQRVMTAPMQGDGRFELFKDPMGYFLRQLQSYDFEMSQSTTKSLVDSFGFIPVLPGPCSLFRYEHFTGIVDEYFSLTTQPLSGDGSDIVLGNVQLAEDRFPPVLLTFRDKENPIETKRNRPVTGFEHDAIFYFEAEKPLGQLVKQRRRWINGAYMAGYWVLKEGWIGRANHGILTKLGASCVLAFELIQGLLIRLLTPATIACGLMFMVTILPAIFYQDADRVRDILDGEKVSDILLIVAVSAAALYLGTFALFMFAHTPRASPVTDAKSGEVFYQIDPTSAYRPWLFFMSYLLNAIVAVMFIYVGVGVYMMIGWDDSPIYFKVLTLMIGFPYVVALLDGFINSKTPSFRAFFNLLWLTPTFMLSSIWFYVWFPCYASARISDLSWGNRAAHQEYASSEIARHRAYLGRVVSVTIVLCNIFVAALILGVVSVVLSDFLTIVLFSLLGFNVLLHTINVVDMIFRFFTKRVPYWICGEPPPPLRLRASNVPSTTDEASEVSEDEDNTMDFTMDRFSMEVSDTRPPSSSTTSSDDSSTSSEEDDDPFSPYHTRIQLYSQQDIPPLPVMPSKHRGLPPRRLGKGDRGISV